MVGAGSSSSSRRRQARSTQQVVSFAARPASVVQGVLLACTGTVLLLLIAHTLSLQSRAHEHHTSTAASVLPGHLAALPTLADLYGAWPLPGSSSSASAAAGVSGPAQLLVLSYFGSRASLVARLLMLMGVWAGDPEQLKLDPANPLRWWELTQLSSLNDMMLAKYAAPGLPHALGRGFSAARLTREDLDYYGDRTEQVLRYLNAHQPWLLKDPRLALFAPLWLERLDAPLCLLVVDLQPEQLAQHLETKAARRQQQQQAGVGGGAASDSSMAAMTGSSSSSSSSSSGQATDIASASLHLERWTNSTLSSIKACFAVPTLVVPSSVLQPSLVRPVLAVLQQHLRLAGVRGTRLPPAALLQQQFLDHLHAAAATVAAAGSSSSSGGGIGFFCGSNGSNPAATAAAAALAAAAAGHEHSAAALLQEAPCTWLPPKPRSGSAGAQDAGSAGSDVSLLPLPTRALVEVLHDHLAATFARPDPDLQYNRVAGRLWSAYTARVAALVAAGSHPQQHPHHVSEHHSIQELVLEALRHVEASVGASSSSGSSSGSGAAHAA